jgi:hypothetical protein
MAARRFQVPEEHLKMLAGQIITHSRRNEEFPRQINTSAEQLRGSSAQIRGLSLRDRGAAKDIAGRPRRCRVVEGTSVIQKNKEAHRNL